MKENKNHENVKIQYKREHNLSSQICILFMIISHYK